MRDPAEVAAELRGCILCGRNPIVSIGWVVPVDDASYAAVLKMRTTPLHDDHTPTIGYGLCQEHDVARSTELVEAKLLAAAAKVVVQ